ncbi:hypothetical protein CLV92_10639 [Kineococcus xinjiangensis]|uniref:Uncharacterized protein n=1 Tax=Kineococcus xinjiangensis TaxID=512762 RepID=A0A2S6IM03_9ACTN|nr:hypothetical protein [Kineococcus xinjiangensis]PPK95218.1 hypothetical protein CLV92_10639 [Kineococcus xinjiangensis]
MTPSSWPRLAVATALGLVALSLVLPAPAPLRAVAVAAFWAWLLGAAVRYVAGGRNDHLLPGAVNAALGLAGLAALSQLAIALGLDAPAAITLGTALAAAAAVLLRRPSPDAAGEAPHGDHAALRPVAARQAVGVGGAAHHDAPHLDTAHHDGAPPREVRPAPGGAGAAADGRGGPTARWTTWAGAVGVAVALALWALSLGGVDLDRLNGYGLLAAVPLLWYVALAICVAVAAVTALHPARHRGAFWAAIAGIVLILHATPAVAYDMPRYTWTFKHIGVVEYIRAANELPRLRDIYYNWPGFFAAAEWFTSAASLDVRTAARWAPPFFEILNASAVWYLARSLTRDARTVRLATLVFALTIWVGQDYFAPQPLAFFLGIVLIAVLVRAHRAGGALHRDSSSSGRERALLAAGAALIWIGTMTTHQLTPVVVLLVLFVLTALLRWRAWWLVVAFAVLEVAWLALAWPYLAQSPYSLFSFNPLDGSSADVLSRYEPMEGVVFRRATVYVLYFGMFAVGGGWALLTGRRSVASRIALVGAFAPALVLLAQDYGGEGQLRTYLYALPFLAFSVARAAVAGLERLGAGLRPVATVAGAAVLTALFLPAYLGQERVNRVVPADVAAAEWFYANAAPGTEMIGLAPNSPSRIDERYLDYPLQSETSPTAFVSEEFQSSPDAAAVVEYLRTQEGNPYLVATPSQAGYLEYFGAMQPERFYALQRELDQQPGLRLVFRQDGASVWQVLRS